MNISEKAIRCRIKPLTKKNQPWLYYKIGNTHIGSALYFARRNAGVLVSVRKTFGLHQNVCYLVQDASKVPRMSDFDMRNRDLKDRCRKRQRLCNM